MRGPELDPSRTFQRPLLPELSRWYATSSGMPRPEAYNALGWGRSLLAAESPAGRSLVGWFRCSSESGGTPPLTDPARNSSCSRKASRRNVSPVALGSDLAEGAGLHVIDEAPHAVASDEGAVTYRGDRATKMLF